MDAILRFQHHHQELLNVKLSQRTSSLVSTTTTAAANVLSEGRKTKALNDQTEYSGITLLTARRLL